VLQQFSVLQQYRCLRPPSPPRHEDRAPGNGRICFQKGVQSRGTTQLRVRLSERRTTCGEKTMENPPFLRRQVGLPKSSTTPLKVPRTIPPSEEYEPESTNVGRRYDPCEQASPPLSPRLSPDPALQTSRAAITPRNANPGAEPRLAHPR
jgi:hypothetical protein